MKIILAFLFSILAIVTLITKQDLYVILLLASISFLFYMIYKKEQHEAHYVWFKELIRSIKQAGRIRRSRR